MLIKHNLRPEQAVEARDCLVDTLVQTNTLFGKVVHLLGKCSNLKTTISTY